MSLKVLSQESSVSAPSGEAGALALLLLAAGSGSRLGAGIPKAAVELDGKTLLAWALEGALASGLFSRVVVTVPAADSLLTRVSRSYGALPVVGGDSRAESVSAALAALDQASPLAGASDRLPSAVLVHDSARCFTPVEVYRRVAGALAAGEKAVIPVLPVVDTIKTVDAAGFVTGTPAREQLRAVQTPQGFDLPTLVQAHRDSASLAPELAEKITDDAMLAEALGLPVATVEGAVEAFKVTTPLDLTLASALLKEGRVG